MVQGDQGDFDNAEDGKKIEGLQDINDFNFFEEEEFPNFKIGLFGFSIYLSIQMIFILLKLFNVLTWSWLFILSPVIAPFCLIVLIMLFGLFISLLSGEW